jgi:hypothetical protein
MPPALDLKADSLGRFLTTLDVFITPECSGSKGIMPLKAQGAGGTVIVSRLLESRGSQDCRQANPGGPPLWLVPDANTDISRINSSVLAVSLKTAHVHRGQQASAVLQTRMIAKSIAFLKVTYPGGISQHISRSPGIFGRAVPRWRVPTNVRAGVAHLFFGVPLFGTSLRTTLTID